MRILYDHQVFSLQNVGGASRYHYELMRYLATVPDVQTEVFLGVSHTGYPFKELRSGRTSVMGIRAPLPRGMFCYLLNEALESGIAPFRSSVDVYHPTYFRRMPMIRARRTVATHHDCTHELFPQLFPDVGKVLRAKKALYAKADMIICISEASRRCLLQFYAVDPSRTRVVHHGLTRLPRCLAAAMDLQARLRRQYLLFVGIRHTHKNFDGLLQAYRETRLHTEYDLLALGGGAMTSSETDRIAQLGLSDNVKCVPMASDALLAEAYAGAKLFVYPSMSEGFGIPPLEAMAAGCPVVASNTSAIPEVCQNAPFYFDPYDAVSFHQALLRGVNDEDARQDAIERGSQVAAGYSWEKCGQETLAIYRECQ
jgi:glycosyltransferase involved in cell wall biosynthesis